MRFGRYHLGLLLSPVLGPYFLTTFSVAASAESIPLRSVLVPVWDISRRDDVQDHHSHPHAAPLLELNETQVTLRALMNSIPLFSIF